MNSKQRQIHWSQRSVLINVEILFNTNIKYQHSCLSARPWVEMSLQILQISQTQHTSLSKSLQNEHISTLTQAQLHLPEDCDFLPSDCWFLQIWMMSGRREQKLSDRKTSRFAAVSSLLQSQEFLCLSAVFLKMFLLI